MGQRRKASAFGLENAAEAAALDVYFN